jgi:hypothetical protein
MKINNIIEINSKKESINILTEYFQKFNIKELKYYLNNDCNLNIPEFLFENVVDPENIELYNLLLEHLKIVINKIFNSINSINLLNNIKSPIKISFISNSIYWYDLFVIKNNIFISYPFLINVFEKIEYNEYNEMKNIYIYKNKIYDMLLLKKLSYCIYTIFQNLNQNISIEFIENKYNCKFISISNIKFINEYKIVKEPNVEFIQDKITVYWFNSNTIYGVFNSIYSNLSFTPYWENKIIKLSYENGIYTEINNINLDKDIKNLIHNPFENRSNYIIDTILFC